MSQPRYQAALPARYFGHAAVVEEVGVRQFDPSGRNRPAIGFVPGTTGALAYTDSADRVQWMAVVTAGVYYQADIKTINKAVNVVAAEAAGNNAVTTTAYKLTLYWAP
jgi:hypothetical protein